MKRIVLLLLAMVVIVPVPCLSFEGYQGHEGQIPICQNISTGALKFAPMKDIAPGPSKNYEPNCNTKTERLIWVTLGPPAGPQALLEPMQNVREDALIAQGWTECYYDLYSNYGTPLSTIFSQCSKKYLMLACRPVGSATFTLASYANRTDVLTDTGTGNTGATHVANGTGWYYNSNASYAAIGFGQSGDPFNKNYCDVQSTPNPEMRLCWHTYNGTLHYGFRCGTAAWLNSDPNWERIILHRD